MNCRPLNIIQAFRRERHIYDQTRCVEIGLLLRLFNTIVMGTEEKINRLTKHTIPLFGGENPVYRHKRGTFPLRKVNSFEVELII